MTKSPRWNGQRSLKGRVVVIGGGLAGLFTALKLAPVPVTLVTPEPLGSGAPGTWPHFAIAAAVGAGDSAEAHALDTIATGAGIADETVARIAANEAAARIADLAHFGVAFDRDPSGAYALSRDIGHSADRILYVSGDRAGTGPMRALIARALATPSIELLEGYVAQELITSGTAVTGAILTRGDDPAARFRLEGAAVVLATGGVGGLYEVTTSSLDTRGVAIAIAARAGVAIADAEFVQFHPAPIDVDDDERAPAAHFHIGGIKTDSDGRTLVPGLWAVGEAASTGVHGANCLAGNSALDAIVFAARVAAAVAALPTPITAPTLTRVRADHLPDASARDTAIKVIRATLQRHAGVTRSGAGLATALDTLRIIAAGADGDIVIENAVITARFIVESALRRKESRGSHVRRDFPETVDTLARRSSVTAAGLSLRDTAAQHMAAVAAAAKRPIH